MLAKIIQMMTRFACSLCTMQFTKSDILELHFRTHTGEKPFACTQCSIRFTYSSDLKTHFRTHTGEKPFACTQCSMRFTQRGSLKTHFRTHTGEKPFACTQCSTRFTQLGHLKVHLMTHTGEKPFACPQCGMRFAESSNLKKHLRTHTGEKPFACPQCRMRFTESGTLKRHLRMNTCERAECSIRLEKFGSLESHVNGKETGRENSLLSRNIDSQINVNTGFFKDDERSPVSTEFSDVSSSANSSVVVASNDYKDPFNYETDCMQAMRNAYQLDFDSLVQSEQDHASLSGVSVEAPAPHTVGTDKCSLINMAVGSASSSKFTVVSEIREQNESISKQAESSECDLIRILKPECLELCKQENEDEDHQDYKDWKLLVDPFVELFALKDSAIQLYG